MNRVVVWLAIALTHSLSVSASENDAVGIYVYGRTVETLTKPEKQAREKALKDERSRAEKEVASLEKRFEKAHGKKSAEWPEDVKREYRDAQAASYLAVLEHHEVLAEQKELTDTAEDIRESIPKVIERAKKTAVALVEGLDEASLRVEVLARRTKSGMPAVTYWLFLKLTPVAWKDPGALVGTALEDANVEEGYVGLTALTGVWSGVTTLHRYTDAAPYWIVMVGQQLNGWGAAAYYAAEVLTEFAAVQASGE